MIKSDLQDRFIGAMLWHALGDSLGAPWEGSPPFTGHLKRVLPLRYTDDTEMMINLARAILKAGGLVAEEVAWEFINGFTPVRGYGPGTVRVLELINKGVSYEEATRAVFPEGSMGNGAAMRVTPVGLLYHRDLEKLKQAARAQAELTHAHPLAIEGAKLVALAVAMLLRGIELPGLPDELLPHTEEGEYRRRLLLLKGLIDSQGQLKDAIEHLGNGVLAQESTVLAIYVAIASGGEPMKAIELAIMAGGDTDTIGAMAGAITGAFSGTSSLPQWTAHRLEGYESIKTLAEALYELCLRAY